MKYLRLFLLLFAAATLAVSCATAGTGSFPEPQNLPVQKGLPDVFTMNDGTRVTTPAQWSKRREEMKAILEHYELGHAPPPPGNVSGQDIKSYAVLAGAANYRLVHLKFGPGEKLGFDIAIFTPTNAGPFPTIINPSFSMTPGVNFTNGYVAPTNEPVPTNSTGQAKLNTSRPVDPEKAARGYANALQRGYAIVTYRYVQCGEDNTNFLKSSYYPAYPGYDWGVVRGWAWGLSRVVDYVETQPFADTNKLVALGHSRLGKLVMVATAFDDRIALGAPAGSSGAGTGAYRFCGPGRGGKEGIEDMTRKFPYYWVPRLKEFTGQMQKLPFDAHWFVALTAPRPWISIEGTDDQNCVPNAVKQTVNAAYPVYEFLGVSPDCVGVNYEPHRHALTPEDWIAALDFADQQLRGIDHHRRFDQFPPATPAETATAPYVAPTNTFNVRDFGAVGDGTNLDTVAFQKALDACAVSGGGEVLVPAGNYLIGSVQMGTRTVLRLAQNSVITGSSNLDDYPMMDVRWEGRWETGHRALIYSANVDHTGIIGPGKIVGSTNAAASQNPRGAVVLEPVSCNDVRWEGFSVVQGGNWATHPTYCEGVVIKGLKITGRRDGIDVDSCKNVRIEDCDINTGDDSISLKSGRGLDGARVGKPTEDVVITNCDLVDRRFACVGIGSEVSGGIRNVRMAHCRMTAHSACIYIKSRIGRAGTVENISGNDLDVLGGGFLRVNLITSGNKNTVNDSVEGLAGYTLGRNFSFSDVRLTDAAVLADAGQVSMEKPLDGLSLVNITGTCKKGITLCNTLHAKLRDIRVTGYEGALLTQTNATGVGLDELK
jgi:hypothetical protein